MNEHINWHEQPNWRSRLETALKANRRDAHSRYFQLATTGLDGSPQCRTLVFRGFLGDGDHLLAITDARSQKAAEIERDPRGQVHWYFAQSREQFRLQASLRLCDASDDQAVRTALWAKLSDAARAQFFWPEPGAPLASGDSLPVTEDPPASFWVIDIEPRQVDYLWLAKTHQRIISQRVGSSWQERSVNP